MVQPRTAERTAATARTEAAETTEGAEGAEAAEIAAELSFRQAQTALELCLSQLQASDLDLEAMVGLYRRARCYADRCEQLLSQVEQEILLWDPQQPGDPPRPWAP